MWHPAHSQTPIIMYFHTVYLVLAVLVPTSLPTYSRSIEGYRHPCSLNLLSPPDTLAYAAPGCFKGLWHWDQSTGKSVVTLTPTSKWSMRRRWTQRYLVWADWKSWIRSPEVTEEPWVKFNTVHQGIRFLSRVGNTKIIGIDSLY